MGGEGVTEPLARMDHEWRAFDVALYALGLATSAVGLWCWCNQCAAAHARALRGDGEDVPGPLRARWRRFRHEATVRYSLLPPA